LAAHPYRQFPVVLENKLQGVLTRDEVDKAIAEKRAVQLKPAKICLREETVGRLQQLLIESDTQFVVVLDRPDGQVVGLVTLHDLLRAQTMMAQRSKEDA
jgi:CBS domain-containing protein